jgi:UTP--glucose-1-phosphate uridylyltransferase
VKIRKCLFPVAGYGTRFLPVTKVIPKEMLPILTRPLISFGVEEAVEAGMDHIALVTGRGKRAIEDYFDIACELEDHIRDTPKAKRLAGLNGLIERCHFTSTRQREMKGLGDAILSGEGLIGDEPFGVILTDDLCVGDSQGVMTQLLHAYREHRCSIVAIEPVKPEVVDQYGIVSTEPVQDNLYNITDIIEKPDTRSAPSNDAVIGRYILTPDIFEILRETPPGANGEVQITDALRIQAERGTVLGCRFRGLRFDCGSVEGFVAATNHFYHGETGA